MSRYLILILINIPLVSAGLLGALIDFKAKGASRRRFVLQSVFWLFILVAIVLARPIYIYFYSRHMTTTSSMSLFDVIELTGIVYVLFMASRARARITELERKLREMHSEVAIKLSDDEKAQ